MIVLKNKTAVNALNITFIKATLIVFLSQNKDVIKPIKVVPIFAPNINATDVLKLRKLLELSFCVIPILALED